MQTNNFPATSVWTLHYWIINSDKWKSCWMVQRQPPEDQCLQNKFTFTNYKASQLWLSLLRRESRGFCRWSRPIKPDRKMILWALIMTYKCKGGGVYVNNKRLQPDQLKGSSFSDNNTTLLATYLTTGKVCAGYQEQRLSTSLINIKSNRFFLTDESQYFQCILLKQSSFVCLWRMQLDSCTSVSSKKTGYRWLLGLKQHTFLPSLMSCYIHTFFTLLIFVLRDIIGCSRSQWL